MYKYEAEKITGGLSAPGRMPEGSYNLPANMCQTGAKLRKIKGTPCWGCYAFNGRYRFPNVKDALTRRLESLTHPQWVEAMGVLVQGIKHFRWHDSGDIQSAWHLARILEVCKQTPDTKHWLPTREAKLLALMDPDVVPKNLLIRLSATKVNGAASRSWPWTSTVTDGKDKTCPAPDQGGKCKSCRQCWDRSVKNVQYAKH